MSDPRFARLKSDPRFRRTRKHKDKVTVDERFKSVLTSKADGKSSEYSTSSAQATLPIVMQVLVSINMGGL